MFRLKTDASTLLHLKDDYIAYKPQNLYKKERLKSTVVTLKGCRFFDNYRFYVWFFCRAF
jgi:hypothetical protein